MRYTKEQIDQRFKILPPSVQDAVLSVGVADSIKSIADKHQLHIDQTGLLNEEITYVMVGAEKSSDFIRNLKTQTKLPNNKVNAIAGDVNDKIFLPIRELMKNVTKEAQVESTTENKEPETIINEIHYTSLGGESEEIKQQVAKEREVKPTTPIPENLPTQQEPNLVTRLPSKEKKPSHRDPYREPIE